jgi:hypothetical protein
MSRTQDLIRLLGNTAKDNAGATSLTPIISSAVTNVVDNNFISNLIPVETTSYATANQLPASNNSIGDQAFVSETNRLYIWNGNGWYNIALINTNPTFSVSPQSNYLLSVNDSGYIPSLSVTILATDPEGIPITYSALLSDSASNFITVTQDSGVFTFIPKSVDSISEYDSDGGVFSVTFRASDGVNLALALSEFTIEISNLIENSRYTTLLLKTNSVNSAQNNTFLDSSTNNFTITRSGNVTQGTFSPYGNRWSFQSAAAGQLATSANSALDLGIGDFTYEAWIYPTSHPTWGQIVGPAYGTTGIAFYNQGGNLVAYGQGSLLAWSGILQLNTWQHVVLTRENLSLYFYHNGVKYGSTIANTYTLSNNVFYIGGNSSNSERFDGHISDVRVIKGTAIYTSNFTVPTEPLSNISGTSLLVCQTGWLKDNSSNNIPITPAGTIRISRFSPYDQSSYNPVVDGGSGYFDGSGDYLVSPSSTQYGLSTEDFTIESYFYFTGVNDSVYEYDPIIDFRTGPTDTKPSIWVRHANSASGAGYIRFLIGTSVILDSQIRPVPYTWYHVAVSRNSGNCKLFVNGIEVASATNTTDLGLSNDIAIGTAGDARGNSNFSFNGYLSNIRVIKGTGLYTSNFTPPTDPLTAVANTGLLLKFTNAGIYDESGKSLLETVGAATVGTSVSKYGDGSIDLTGSSAELILDVPDPELVNFRSGDFTVEAWIYPTRVNGDEDGIVALYEYQSDKRSWYIALDNSQLEIRWSTSGTSATQTLNSSVGTFSANQWYHVAMVRSGGTVTGYVNGSSVLSGSITGSLFFDTAGTVRVGRIGTATTSYFPGYIEDLRITKGLARYTANFTPPTEPLSG